MKQTRYSGIDALRTFGCLGILLMHIVTNTNYELEEFFFYTVLKSFVDLVRLFLMISAFGMCCGYFTTTSTGHFDPERFYTRRFGRLWIFFALVVLLDVAIQHTPQAFAEGFMMLTMTFGLLPNNHLSVIGVSWTLGLIFVFYFMFPFFVFLWNKKRRAWFAFAVSLIMSQLCLWFFFTEEYVSSSFVAWKNILYSAPFFLAGGLIYLYREPVTRFVSRFRWPSLAVCLGVTCAYFWIPSQIAGFDIGTLRALLVFSCWLIYAISIDSPVLSNPVTKFLSDISMEIYLTHMVAFRVVEKLGLCYLFGKNIWSYIATAVFTLTILIAGILAYRQLYRLITTKLLRKRTQA